MPSPSRYGASIAMETKVLTADVPLPLAERLDRLAQQLDRAPDAIVQEALDAWVTQEEERHRLTLEGLADVDAGRLIGHAAVEAWARSLDTDAALSPPKECGCAELPAHSPT